MRDAWLPSVLQMVIISMQMDQQISSHLKLLFRIAQQLKVFLVIIIRNLQLYLKEQREYFSTLIIMYLTQRVVMYLPMQMVLYFSSMMMLLIQGM